MTSKIITTILVTAQYTSAWWNLSNHNFITDKNDFYGLVCGFTIVFGSIGAIAGFCVWILYNWDR